MKVIVSGPYPFKSANALMILSASMFDIAFSAPSVNISVVRVGDSFEATLEFLSDYIDKDELLKTFLKLFSLGLSCILTEEE